MREALERDGAVGVVSEAEALVQQAGYRALWESLVPGDVFECQYGCSLSTFRVRQRIPEGLIADMVTWPGCRGVVLETWYHRRRYSRRVVEGVRPRADWWERLGRFVRSGASVSVAEKERGYAE